jgi:hypothetical protein
MKTLELGNMNEYLGRENVTAQYSPCGRLVLFDYNNTATYARDWDRLTLTARGLYLTSLRRQSLHVLTISSSI